MAMKVPRLARPKYSRAYAEFKAKNCTKKIEINKKAKWNLNLKKSVISIQYTEGKSQKNQLKIRQYSTLPASINLKTYRFFTDELT
jgi:rRNA processing protein Krr1/Pno1